MRDPFDKQSDHLLILIMPQDSIVEHVLAGVLHKWATVVHITSWLILHAS